MTNFLQDYIMLLLAVGFAGLCFITTIALVGPDYNEFGEDNN